MSQPEIRPSVILNKTQAWRVLCCSSLIEHVHVHLVID